MASEAAVIKHESCSPGWVFCVSAASLCPAALWRAALLLCRRPGWMRPAPTCLCPLCLLNQKHRPVSSGTLSPPLNSTALYYCFNQQPPSPSNHLSGPQIATHQPNRNVIIFVAILDLIWAYCLGLTGFEVMFSTGE